MRFIHVVLQIVALEVPLIYATSIVVRTNIIYKYIHQYTRDPKQS